MATLAPTTQASPQAVMSLVYKLTDIDPDFRFMSLNDLLSLVNNARADFLHHDYNIAARTVDSIIKTLDDQNGEVQNLAIKWYVLGSPSVRISRLP
jgi:cullin-associated NEDD8-dissociated protein 1